MKNVDAAINVMKRRFHSEANMRKGLDMAAPDMILKSLRDSVERAKKDFETSGLGESTYALFCEECSIIYYMHDLNLEMRDKCSVFVDALYRHTSNVDDDDASDPRPACCLQNNCGPLCKKYTPVTGV